MSCWGLGLQHMNVGCGGPDTHIQFIAAATLAFEGVFYTQRDWLCTGARSLSGPTVWLTEQGASWDASCLLQLAWPSELPCFGNQSGKTGHQPCES